MILKITFFTANMRNLDKLGFGGFNFRFKPIFANAPLKILPAWKEIKSESKIIILLPLPRFFFCIEFISFFARYIFRKRLHIMKWKFDKINIVKIVV